MTRSEQTDWERRFLMRLATIWLAARWRIMGHALSGKQWPQQDLRNDLLGMTDYQHEMRLEVHERLHPR